jgi:hypothetical protein
VRCAPDQRHVAGLRIAHVFHLKTQTGQRPSLAALNGTSTPNSLGPYRSPRNSMVGMSMGRVGPDRTGEAVPPAHSHINVRARQHTMA